MIFSVGLATQSFSANFDFWTAGIYFSWMVPNILALLSVPAMAVYKQKALMERFDFIIRFFRW
jgi:hypothetical protein